MVEFHEVGMNIKNKKNQNKSELDQYTSYQSHRAAPRMR
jgi:hypothetical protein